MATVMNRIKGALLCMPFVLGLAVVPMSANAQDRVRIDWEATLGVNLLTSSSTTSAALMYVTSPMLSTATTTSDITDSILGDLYAVETYMEDNAVAMAHDITMGGGQTVEDLATMAGIEPAKHAAFARVLRAEREGLVELLEPGAIDADVAATFAARIEDALERSEEFGGAPEARPTVM